MSSKRGSSLQMNVAKPIPNNDMILSFIKNDAGIPPGECIHPNSIQGATQSAPGTLANGMVYQFPRAGTLSSLRVKGDTNAVTTDEVFTVQKNGTDTALVATATVGTNEGIDNTHSVAIVAGDYISLKHNANATPTWTQTMGSMYFTPA